MKEYNLCFVGISFPANIHGKFRRLIKELYSIDPKLKIVDPKTPHITLYFMGKQNLSNLKEVAQSIRTTKDKLVDTNIKINDYGIFRPHDPKILYLNIENNPKLNEYNETITQKLEKYGKQRRGFVPHITLSRIKDQESFLQNKDKIVSLIKNVNWKFTVKEIAIYGRELSKRNLRQEKLIAIPI